MTQEGYVVRTPIEYALYWLAVNYPYVLTEAEHFSGGMLVSDAPAFERATALLEEQPSQMLRVTVLDRYVDFGRGPLGVAGFGSWIRDRRTLFALELVREG